MKSKLKIPSCSECIPSLNGPFKHLNGEQLMQLDFEKSCQPYRRGDYVYHEGNRATGCYCVNSGILKLYKTGVDGKEQILAFAKQGSMIGYRSVISAEPFCTTAQVLEDAILCFIPADVLLRLMQQNYSFNIAMFKIICEELGTANDFITDIAQKTVKERLAEILLSLRTTYGTDSEGFLRIELTREELSNVVGTATESVIRQLSEFKNNKYIEIRRRKIKILNLQQLEKQAKISS